MLDQTAAQLVASVDRSAKSATLITTLADLYVNLEDAPAPTRCSVRRFLRAGSARRSRGDRRDQASPSPRPPRRCQRTDDMAPLLDLADAVFAADLARFRKERLESMSGRAQLARRKGAIMTPRSGCCNRVRPTPTASMPRIIANC